MSKDILSQGWGEVKISVVRNAQSTETQTQKLGEIMRWMREGKGNYQQTISDIRETDDKDEQGYLKRSLPAAMFSGTFSRRSAKNLEQHSGILCLDFDHVEDLEAKRNLIEPDEHVIAVFVSPSGTGLKVLVAVPAEPENHAKIFRQAADYFKGYKLDADESGKDVSRLCFLSHDPHLYYNPDAYELQIVPDDTGPSLTAREKATTGSTSGDRIGDRYNTCADIRQRSAAILEGLGWKVIRRSCDQEWWTRPGKERGVSGTLWSNGSFYCFTDNAPPLSPTESYSAFSLYATAKHSGDFKAAAIALVDEFGDPRSPGVDGREFYAKDSEAVGGEEKVTLFQRLQDRKFDPSNIAEPLPPVLTLAGVPIISRGNLLVLKAHDKSGKSHLMAAMAQAIISGGRHLGIESKEQGRVAYLDCEQDREDFDRLMLRHAGGNSDNLAAYHITGYSPKESREVIKAILEGEKDLIALLIDGYADLCSDVNDAAKAFELVASLMALAEKHRVAIIGVLHLNPGSAEKSRGHLGSQLDRKSQTSLQIDVNSDETRTVYTAKARKRPLPKAQGVRFEWSDKDRGFVEIEGTPGELKQAQNVEEWSRILYDVQAQTDMLAWKHKDLVKAIMDATEKTERTARTRISDMLKADLLEHNGNTGIYTSKLPTENVKKRHDASNEET